MREISEEVSGIWWKKIALLTNKPIKIAAPLIKKIKLKLTITGNYC